MEIHSIINIFALALIFQHIGRTKSAKIFEKFHFHKAVVVPPFPSNETFIFQTLTQVSVHECIEECKRIRICDCINYHVRSLRCDLIKSNSTEVTVQAGYVYGAKMDWDMKEATQRCQTCDTTQSCEFETTPESCSNEACGPPAYIPGTILYGNMLRTGDRLLYQCNGTSSSSSNITCLNNGEWSQANINCSSELECIPSTDVTFQHSALPDQTDFVFYVSTEAMNFWAGGAFCASMCSHLVVVDTINKFTALKNRITSNSEYSNNIDYFVNGEYNTTSNTFVTSTGVELEYNSGMWASHPDDYSTEQPCIRMKEENNYKINTYRCTASFGVICEQD